MHQSTHHCYKHVFNTPEGKQVLADLQDAHHFLGPLTRQTPIDPYRMAMAEGERNVVLRIMALLEHEPERQTNV